MESKKPHYVFLPNPGVDPGLLHCKQILYHSLPAGKPHLKQRKQGLPLAVQWLRCFHCRGHRFNSWSEANLECLAAKKKCKKIIVSWWQWGAKWAGGRDQSGSRNRLLLDTFPEAEGKRWQNTLPLCLAHPLTLANASRWRTQLEGRDKGAGFNSVQSQGRARSGPADTLGWD